ncbi:MAG: aminotransferase class I/II-fold pyridoxal phosphate-dependent enzyme [Streptosporangiales bacterium]|nr:aminotransferase class I/II-fold pyridoxal phosphate-dependent enzyme [Streptosporangiales bacterium]
MKLSERARGAEPFYAMAFGDQAAALEAAGHKVAKLNIGEPDFGALPAVRETMRGIMDGRALPYTSAFGLPALREAIAGFYRDQHGVDVDPARIAVTSGASGALLLACAATLDPGDEVILADPSYPANRQLIQAFGGVIRSVATTPQARYQLDAGSVASAWTDKTKAVMIASPSNPTGTSIPHGELASICAGARERDAWRVVDEIYLNLADPAPDGAPARSVLDADPGAIVINSFSKYFGMTGWRLGWAVLPAELTEPVERLAMSYYICASTPAQTAALSCFTPESLAIAEERRLELLARRQIVLDGLAKIGLPVPVPPDGAFYVYFDISGTGLTAWDFCQRVLAEAHVALTPGRDFSDGTADTHVRLSYAASREALHDGLERIAAFLA